MSERPVEQGVNADAGREIKLRADLLLDCRSRIAVPIGMRAGRESERKIADYGRQLRQRPELERETRVSKAWQAGDLEKMLSLYHPRFHSWNRVSGALDGHDSLLARWRRALQSETIVAVRLDPIVVERYGDFAAAYYVSHETVRMAPTAPAAGPGVRRVANQQSSRFTGAIISSGRAAAGSLWATRASIAPSSRPRLRPVALRTRPSGCAGSR